MSRRAAMPHSASGRIALEPLAPLPTKLFVHNQHAILECLAVTERKIVAQSDATSMAAHAYVARAWVRPQFENIAAFDPIALAPLCCATRAPKPATQAFIDLLRKSLRHE